MGIVIDITNGVVQNNIITEGLRFGTFDSIKKGLRLVSRSAPSPSPVEVKEAVFGKNGVWNFSSMLGERTFENRRVTYTLTIEQRNVPTRQNLQTNIENELMREGEVKLYDTYSPGYYYIGSCVAVNVDDDYMHGRLKVTVEFNCYPYKISELPEGHDIWDDFNFELDVSQPIEYAVNGSRSIVVINNGLPSVSLTVEASAQMEITKGTQKVTVPAGISKNELFRLSAGESTLTVKGNGTIKFNFHKELI